MRISLKLSCSKNICLKPLELKEDLTEALELNEYVPEAFELNKDEPEALKPVKLTSSMSICQNFSSLRRIILKL
jgi:hypothetical protein